MVAIGRYAMVAMVAMGCAGAHAAPHVFRLTPPSELFVSGDSAPIVARFAPGQRFDLQATVIPDPGQTIVRVGFSVDGAPVTAAPGASSLVTHGLAPLKPSPNTRPRMADDQAAPPGTAVATLRAFSHAAPGEHRLRVRVEQSDGQVAMAEGNFEIVEILPTTTAAKNLIILLGDGMGIAHRTAARIVLRGIAQGKARAPLAMDTFPHTALVMTPSLNSVVTDSAPGMQNYVTGNKAANNQEGVFPDDTLDAFDNPRVEYLSEYLRRTQNKTLGIVTTADVFDATPASMAAHTQSRNAGTGIVDQFFDEREASGLTVLMGGGRRWFLPNPTRCDGGQPRCERAGGPAPFNGSARDNDTDYVLPDDAVVGWGAQRGALDPARDLIGAFTGAGWQYAHDAASLRAADDTAPLLGLFALSNMNVAMDKIAARRLRAGGDANAHAVVDDFGFPDQPMLDEMTDKALAVLAARSPNGFVLLVEGASIDKQSHAMDSERWLVDTIEFDKAVARAQRFAAQRGDTLVIVTADHECGGVSIIGAARVDNQTLRARAQSGAGTAANGPRKDVVGAYEHAGFPRYVMAADGYPLTMDPDYKLLIGYGANADRNEDWLTNPLPLREGLQPGAKVPPLDALPKNPLARDLGGGFKVTGQIEEDNAVHTGADVPLSAFGPGAELFAGVIDNTDVFFKILQVLRAASVR